MKERDADSRDGSGYIYFIQAVPDGLIKIGVTRLHPDRRLRNLRASSPVPLHPIGYMPGTRDDEQALHARFAEFREHGEWFQPVPQIWAYIYGHAPTWVPRARNAVSYLTPAGHIRGLRTFEAKLKRATAHVRAHGVPERREIQAMNATDKEVIHLAECLALASIAIAKEVRRMAKLLYGPKATGV